MGRLLELLVNWNKDSFVVFSFPLVFFVGIDVQTPFSHKRTILLNCMVLLIRFGIVLSDR